MTTFFRCTFALILSLVLTATAQNMALARGQTMVAGQMVICTGTGVATVQIDADGNPVEPTHICPDCALTLLIFAGAAPAEPQPSGIYRAVVFGVEASQGRDAQTVGAKARAPPVGAGIRPA